MKYLTNYSFLLPLKRILRLLTVLPLITLSQPLHSQNSDGFYLVDSIIIIRNDIFTPEEAGNNSIYSVANKLHPLTAEYVIRRELLFEEDEPCSRQQIEESERNLRKMGIIGNIAINVDTLENQRLLVTVETQDKWTKSITTAYKQEGDITSLGAGFRDSNFLGKGQYIWLSYNYRSDRINPHGIQFVFRERRLFGSRWRTAIQFNDSEELNNTSLLLDRLYYSDTAVWATSIYADYGRNLVKEYENGEIISQYQTSQQNQDFWLSRSFGTKLKFRLASAYYRNRSQSNKTFYWPFENIDLVSFSVNLMNRNYYKTNFLNNFGRDEDVSVGYLANILFGKNLKFSRLNNVDTFIKFNWQQAFDLGKRYYLFYGFSFASCFENRVSQDLTTTLTLQQYFKLPLHQTFVTRFSGIYGYNWSEGRQLLLGSPTGLRGYSAYRFSGQRQVLINLEDRIFTNLNFWIFRVGGAIFFDSGMAWKENEPIGNQRLHSSAGFGLRLENIKQRGNGITRIDFAFNFDEQRFTEIILTSSQLFDAIIDLDFLAPSYILK